VVDFCRRHIGSSLAQQQEMLTKLGYSTGDEFINNVIPPELLTQIPLEVLKDDSAALGAVANKDDGLNCTDESLIKTKAVIPKQGLSEEQALSALRTMMEHNQVLKNFIGLGYYDTITPAVIRRNLFENPGWYTAYTPYQAEISQGRLEGLLNYQQLIMDLTGLAIANASLLDEGTAAAEAMAMAQRINPHAGNKFLVSPNIFPQTLQVLATRAHYLNIELIIAEFKQVNPRDFFGVLLQNPDLYGGAQDYSQEIKAWKESNQHLVVAMICDLLSLVVFKSPAAQGADIAVGSTQRFGVPIGFGGPAAAYMATREAYKRTMPGRIIGVSQDARGKRALRMALQTREQHIRREKAPSNICTAQVLLANMAGMYAVYHGFSGLKQIATRIMCLSATLAHNLQLRGIKLAHNQVIFDTVCFSSSHALEQVQQLKHAGYAIGCIEHNLFISIGESATLGDIENLVNQLAPSQIPFSLLDQAAMVAVPDSYLRQEPLLTHPVFNSYHSETKMMRYLKYLENKDISLVHSMIPLGSCTMKLNPAAALEPLSWHNVAQIHPYAPLDTVGGYLKLIESLALQLQEITGFAAVSLQPNSGAQGEYSGLLAIRRYQESSGEAQRNICLIPKSAHGTNPATASIMGLEVVVVECDELGNVDLADLEFKASAHKSRLSCLMITYPSTHGVFEARIKAICAVIHGYGGQVYMDGANLNAQVGLLKPAELGADVAHINLHKTFAIPHGGGGPGMGPIGVAKHLAPFLPGNPHAAISTRVNAVNSSPYGSASILVISWMYISMLGTDGLVAATKNAILNANYLAYRLRQSGYTILYSGKNNHVAHECIIDLRPLKAQSGISEVDIAKRLMDYGFHAPTMSFPVAGTLMVEPTESESLEELERFACAMHAIYEEIQEVIAGTLDRDNNLLKNAPHTLADIRDWDKPYSITKACFALEYLKEHKIFPQVNRVDDVFGDRNFICSCS
jgi:glycine dehydrogenase